MSRTSSEKAVCCNQPLLLQPHWEPAKSCKGTADSTKNPSDVAPPGLVDAPLWPLQLLRRSWDAWDSLGKFHKASQYKTKTYSHPNIILYPTMMSNPLAGRGSALRAHSRRRGVAWHSLCTSTGRDIAGASTGCSCRRKQKWLDIANIPQMDAYSLTPGQTLGWLQSGSHASPWRKQILLLFCIWANLMFACGRPSSELPGVILWLCECSGTTASSQINFHSFPPNVNIKSWSWMEEHNPHGNSDKHHKIWHMVGVKRNELLLWLFYQIVYHVWTPQHRTWGGKGRMWNWNLWQPECCQAGGGRVGWYTVPSVPENQQTCMWNVRGWDFTAQLRSVRAGNWQSQFNMEKRNISTRRTGSRRRV